MKQLLVTPANHPRQLSIIIIICQSSSPDNHSHRLSVSVLLNGLSSSSGNHPRQLSISINSSNHPNLLSIIITGSHPFQLSIIILIDCQWLFSSSVNNYHQLSIIIINWQSYTHQLSIIIICKSSSSVNHRHQLLNIIICRSSSSVNHRHQLLNIIICQSSSSTVKHHHLSIIIINYQTLSSTVKQDETWHSTQDTVLQTMQWDKGQMAAVIGFRTQLGIRYKASYLQYIMCIHCAKWAQPSHGCLPLLPYRAQLGLWKG